MNMCRGCKGNSPRVHYYTILGRIDKAILEAQQLLRDAEAQGDEQTAWVARRCIKAQQEHREKLNPPPGVA